MTEKQTAMNVYLTVPTDRPESLSSTAGVLGTGRELLDKFLSEAEKAGVTHLRFPADVLASDVPSMGERIAAALECLEDNDNHGATVILKTALGVMGAGDGQ